MRDTLGVLYFSFLFLPRCFFFVLVKLDIGTPILVASKGLSAGSPDASGRTPAVHCELISAKEAQWYTSCCQTCC